MPLALAGTSSNSGAAANNKEMRGEMPAAAPAAPSSFTNSRRDGFSNDAEPIMDAYSIESLGESAQPRMLASTDAIRLARNVVAHRRIVRCRRCVRLAHVAVDR